ncbi:hypothetical protein BJX61DRAFT_531514 [Aspergillus egyptiacus]|nr:hypothetical protein BJX61DRAFT_531514 [Aspergillus egyptiacus]
MHASGVPSSVTLSKLQPDMTTTISGPSQHAERRGQFPRNRATFNTLVNAPFCPDNASQYILLPNKQNIIPIYPSLLPNQSHAQVSADNNNSEAYIHASDNLTTVPKSKLHRQLHLFLSLYSYFMSALLTNSIELHEGSCKGMLYLSEEQDLLLKLRRDKKQPWAKIIKLFSEQFPGQSPGAIQVFWSMTIKNMSH